MMKMILFQKCTQNTLGNKMKMLSTGMPSTLENYKILIHIFFGKSSSQAKFIDKKISESALGGAEEVIADESQMLYLLKSM